MRNFMAILIAGLTVVAGCTSNQAKPHMIMAEGGVTGDVLSISGGNVVVIENQPGIAFATVTTPGQPKRVAYFLVFNSDEPRSVTASCFESGSSANTSHTINTFGNECTVKYDIVLKDEMEFIEIEKISISDKEYDMEKGRLFLIDMEATSPSVKQINLDLPIDLPALNQPDATELFGKDTLKAFRNADRIVDVFCRSIETRGK